jgi:hypothetical protein
MLLVVLTARAGTLDVYDADALWDAIDHVKPGDDIVVHEGVYETQQSTGSWLRNVVLPGNEGGPITVRAADGENVVIEGDPAGSQNILNLSGTWFRFRGFEMRFGSKGLRLFESHDAEIEHLVIHDVGDVGISANEPGDTYAVLYFRFIEIYNTGIDGGTGECFYLGCQGDACQVSESHVEYSWCHDTQSGSQGDGIEIKSGSYGNWVQDNVIHDVNYPGITMYGSRGRGPNVVSGNVVWNSLTEGIQIVGEVYVRENIVFSTASYGIFSKSSDGQDPTELAIFGNTVVNGTGTCLRVNDWTKGKDIVVANNAFYCDGGTGIEVSGDPGSATWIANAVTGANGAPSGTFDGLLVDAAFENPVAHDYYPRKDSPLVGAADPDWVASDFNCYDREAPPNDVGAYERFDATNPGWIPSEGFKECGPPREDTGGHHGDDDGTGDDGGGDDSSPTTDDSTVGDDSAPNGMDSAYSGDDGCGCGTAGGSSWIPAVVMALAAGRRRYPALFAAVPPNAAK